MAKKIKAIQCPQCGSTDHRLLKDDYYKCLNCGTNYILDNDDINVNITHRVEKQNVPQVNPKAAIGIIAGILIFITLIIVVPFFLKSGGSGVFKTRFKGRAVISKPVNIQNKLYILALTQSGQGDGPKDIYAEFLDVEKNEVVKSEKIESLNKISSFDSKARRFSDGKLYITVNKQRILVVSNKSLEVTDITDTLFEGDSLYTAGVVNAEIYGSYGDSFKVMNGMGREYYYYPLVKKSYPTDKIHSFTSDKKYLNSAAKDSIVYLFTEKSSSSIQMDVSEEFKLLKVIYTSNTGDIQNNYFRARWEKVFGKNKNELEISVKHLVSYTDLTPGRIYFNPKIIYFDNDRIFVWITTNASDQSERILQRLDAKTGELVWSVPIETKSGRYVHFYDQALFASGTLIMTLNNTEYFTIDDNGKNIKYFNLYGTDRM